MLTKVNFHFLKASLRVSEFFMAGYKASKFMHTCIWNKKHSAVVGFTIYPYFDFLEHRRNASSILESSPAWNGGNLACVVGSVRWHTDRNCNDDVGGIWNKQFNYVFCQHPQGGLKLNSILRSIFHLKPTLKFHIQETIFRKNVEHKMEEQRVMKLNVNSFFRDSKSVHNWYTERWVRAGFI